MFGSTARRSTAIESGHVDAHRGVGVARERRRKGAPTCPTCHTKMEICPNCENKVTATVEKGIDTALATDMIRLAWEDAFDIGLIVSSDSDFVPVVQFLDSRGHKMIQAGFPPQGFASGNSLLGFL